MTATALTYCDFAENDRVFFREAYDNGIRGSVLAPFGKDICVWYFKHMVSEYGGACTGAGQNARENALRTHNLQVLVRYIQRNMGIAIPQEVEDSLDRVNGFGMQTVYPGQDSFLPSGKDIDKANAAVELTRRFVLEACGRKRRGRDDHTEGQHACFFSRNNGKDKGGQSVQLHSAAEERCHKTLKKARKKYERKYGDPGPYPRGDGRIVPGNQQELGVASAIPGLTAKKTSRVAPCWFFRMDAGFFALPCAVSHNGQGSGIYPGRRWTPHRCQTGLSFRPRRCCTFQSG